MAARRLKVDGLVCDLDGVVYRGSRVIPGAPEAVAAIRSKGIKVVFATNNATHTVEHYRDRLAAVAIETRHDDIVTSAVVTVEEILQRGWRDRSMFLVGGDGLTHACRAAGLEVLEGRDGRHAEVVVVSGTPRLTYDDIRDASFAVRAGADFLATNADPTFPAADGLWPGAGAILASIQVASGRTAEVMGKPHRPMMEAIRRRLDACSAVAAIGDQPGTDLAGARMMGWTTVLVLSGVTDENAAALLEIQPDATVPTVVEASHLFEGPREVKREPKV